MREMEKTKIRRFQCVQCPCHMVHTGAEPAKAGGVFLRFGDRYCTGGKRARRFRPGDPKIYPPSWCPRQKDPVEYRIYAYTENGVSVLPFFNAETARQNQYQAGGSV